jgi:SurA N-terminal domain
MIGRIPVKRTTRRVGATASVALGGALLLSACNTHPGRAAYVGDRSISTSTLQGVVSRSLGSDCGKSYARQPVVLERVKLSDLIYAQLLQQLADRLGVQVTDADVQDQLRKESDVYGGQRVIELQASQSNAVAAGDLSASVRARVLRDRVEDALTANVATPDSQLRSYFDAHPEQYLAGHARAMVVADKATADAVVQQLKSEPGAFGRIIAEQSQKQQAAGLRPDPQAVQTLGPHIGLNPKSIIDAGGFIGLVPLSQLGAAGYPTDPGAVFDLQLSNGWNVVQIIDRQSFDDVKQQVRRDVLANQRGAALTRALADQLRRTPVHVNPRYGRWDAKQLAVVPVTDDAVAAPTQFSATKLQCGQGQG